MTRITINETFRSLLDNVIEPVELCDESGNVLGRFMPKFDPSKVEWLTPDISEEELQRRMNSDERRYSTAEVIAYLENLDVQS